MLYTIVIGGNEMDKWEIMYFIAPNGDFYKVERFNVFCDTFGLDPLEMCKVWVEEIGEHKGWTKADVMRMCDLMIRRAYRSSSLQKACDKLYPEQIDTEDAFDYEQIYGDIVEEDEQATDLICFLVQSLCNLPKPILVEVLNRLPQEILEEIE